MRRRLERAWRGLMRAWALRWKVIRNDPKERGEARECLAGALRCRDLGRQAGEGRGGGRA